MGCNGVFGIGGMVTQYVVSGVAVLAGVVWVYVASSNNMWEVGNQCGFLAPSLAFLLKLFNSWQRSDKYLTFILKRFHHMLAHWPDDLPV